MKLSTKGEYGVLACFDLAVRYREGPVPLKGVAERQGISEAYLEQLFGSLRRAGVIRSVRGAQGGYVLAREPETITVGDIIRVLEGPIVPVECVGEDSDGASPCARFEGCVTRGIWEKLRDSMTRVLDSYSLADMVSEAAEREKSLAGGRAGPARCRDLGGTDKEDSDGR